MEICKLKGCSDVYTVERSFKNIRILFENIEIELKRLHMSNRDLPNQKLKYRVINEKLHKLQTSYSFKNTDNCIKFLDEIGSKIFVEKVVADEFGNYRHEGIQEICQEKEAHMGKSDVRYGKNTFTSPIKKKSRRNQPSEELSTPKRSNLDRGLTRMESKGTQCFANSVMQLVFLSDNDFYNIEENKKFIYSKQHESAAEFLFFILDQFQSRTPDLMECLNYKEENSLICEHCKTSRIISEFEAPILNININDINNKKDINSAIKGMLEYEIESVARKCLLCNKISSNMAKKRIIRKYPKYLFVELTKNIMDKDSESMGIDFISLEDSVYVNEFFTPNTPYKLKGFIAYERFGR
uniref:USP domain-containing protein n=1 Tax=Strongyloides papillosus TaxID=174720 RepID=A0A0N5B317_STREA